MKIRLTKQFPTSPGEIVVIGIGQEMRGDDGAGLAVVHRWQKQYPQTASRVRVVLCPLPGLDLLNEWDGARVAIIVDAVLSGARLGRDEVAMHELERADLKSFGTDSRFAHGWGLAESLEIAETLGDEDGLPEIKILAISGAEFELGTRLSPLVNRCLPRAIDRLEELVIGFLEPLDEWMPLPAHA